MSEAPGTCASPSHVINDVIKDVITWHMREPKPPPRGGPERVRDANKEEEAQEPPVC